MNIQSLVHRVLDRLTLAFVLSLALALISSLVIVNQWPRLVFFTLAGMLSATGGLLGVTNRRTEAAQGYLMIVIAVALACLSAQIATGLGLAWLGTVIMAGCIMVAVGVTLTLRALSQRAAR